MISFYRSYKGENLSLHVKKTHHLKGVQSEFVVLKEELKLQTEFVNAHLKSARVK